MGIYLLSYLHNILKINIHLQSRFKGLTNNTINHLIFHHVMFLSYKKMVKHNVLLLLLGQLCDIEAAPACTCSGQDT